MFTSQGGLSELNSEGKTQSRRIPPKDVESLFYIYIIYM